MRDKNNFLFIVVYVWQAAYFIRRFTACQKRQG